MDKYDKIIEKTIEIIATFITDHVNNNPFCEASKSDYAPYLSVKHWVGSHKSCIFVEFSYGKEDPDRKSARYHIDINNLSYEIHTKKTQNNFEDEVVEEAVKKGLEFLCNPTKKNLLEKIWDFIRNYDLNKILKK